jgi:hypothetical protein
MMDCVITAAGLCTDMIFKETAAVTIGSMASGWSIGGVGASSTKNLNGSGGLEGKFMGECALASTTLKRSEANDLVLKTLSKYESRLKNPPKGVLFPDCYHKKTGIPLENVESTYKQARTELGDIGLRFPC